MVVRERISLFAGLLLMGILLSGLGCSSGSMEGEYFKCGDDTLQFGTTYEQACVEHYNPPITVPPTSCVWCEHP